MNDKLQELTDKIFREGLEKGKKEADEILAKAKADADELLKAARNEAGRIKEEAKKDSEEMKKNTTSELTMSTKQAVTSIKQHITDVIVDEAVNEAVENAFSDKDFMKKLILKMAENWNQIEKEGKDVMFFLSKDDHEELEKFLLNTAALKIKGGLTVNFEEGIKSGFKLGPKDGSYKLSFTDDDFKLFFSQYLRPRTKKFFAED